MTSIILAGVGGQGTVMASKLLAESAMIKGLPVRTAETIGMAQRGGCVVTHVRIGECDSSMVPMGQADMIIGFEPGEALRSLGYLKPGGSVVTAIKGVMPVSASLGGCSYDPDKVIEYLKKNVKNLTLVDADGIAEKCGSYKVVNVVLLGAAASARLDDITPEAMEYAVSTRVPPNYVELNLKALAEYNSELYTLYAKQYTGNQQ